VCFFKVLGDAVFAERAFRAQTATPGLPPKAAAGLPPAPSTTSALQLLALLQREGRFVDFLQQDVASFSDAEIGAAARVVHDGCRKALHEHLTISPVRREPEGERVVLEDGFNASEVKLTGNVRGGAPYKGVLRHKGWRADRVTLPTPIQGHDPNVLAPAEVEL
jgi:hypothetical protein